jgi:transposase
MSVMPAPFPPEFRQRAVQLAREGTTPVAKIAKDLGISESCLRNWMAQSDAEENSGGQRLASTEKRELADLRKRNRVLESR